MTTVPNLLTFGRIAVIPALVGAFYLAAPTAAWVAFALFAAAALTDLLDGYLARALGQHSALGRVLDPLADKLLVAAALLMLVAFDRAPVIPAVLILTREILISGLREALAGRHEVVVSRAAKWKTASQMVALALLLIASAFPAETYGNTHRILYAVGSYSLWLAAVLSWATAISYFRDNVRHLTSGG